MLRTKDQREAFVFYTLFWLFVACVVAAMITMLGIINFLLAIVGIIILCVLYVAGAMCFMGVDRWIERGAPNGKAMASRVD